MVGLLKFFLKKCFYYFLIDSLIFLIIYYVTFFKECYSSKNESEGELNSLYIHSFSSKKTIQLNIYTKQKQKQKQKQTFNLACGSHPYTVNISVALQFNSVYKHHIVLF